jgi:tellurite methyltransferase
MSTADRTRWDARWSERPHVGPPSAFVVSLAPLLPTTGRALDVAGGTGRHALWLAERGLDVTLLDISPVGLEIARREAASRGLRIETVAADLDVDPLPAGPWDLLLATQFLWPPLFAHAAELLAPRGLLAVAQPTLRNLERHAHPGPQFLLEDGVLPSLVCNLDIVRYEEGWLDEGRHEAQLVARRPGV